MTEETSEKLKNSEKSSKSRDKSHKWDKVKVLKKVCILCHFSEMLSLGEI